MFLHKHKVRFWAAEDSAIQQFCVAWPDTSLDCRSAASLTPCAFLLQVVHHDLKVSTLPSTCLVPSRTREAASESTCATLATLWWVDPARI